MEKPKIGDWIRFHHISDFTGKELEVEGDVIGDDEAVRKMWPIEMVEAKGCFLVRRRDNFGNTFHHTVFLEEIISIKKGG